MARGTGLPFPENDVLIQPSPSVAGQSSAAAQVAAGAQAWGQLAEAGARLANTGVHVYEHEAHRAKVGYLADQELEIRRTRTELQDKFSQDPAGFDKAWMAYTEGKLGKVEPSAVNHIKRELGNQGNAAYSSLLSEKRGRDRALDSNRIKLLTDQTGGDVITSAMAGELNGPRGLAALQKYRSVLDSAVTANLMTQEEADLRFNDTTSRAGAETVIKSIGDKYRVNRATGEDAGALALKEAEDQLLRTTDPRLQGLSEEQRYNYYHKATAEIRALEAERKRDLSDARREKTEAETIMGQGVRVPNDTIDDIADRLKKNGGHGDAARLRASAVRHDRLTEFGKQPLSAQVQQYQGVATSLGASFKPEIGAAIDTAAAEAGVDVRVLRRFAQIESGGDPRNVTGSYKGLFQLSDQEFAKYGGGDIFNPQDNARAAARKIAAESAQFKAQFGRDATPFDLYMVHQQGAGGYAAHLANPSAPAWQNMASTAEGRQKGEAWAKAAIWRNIPDKIKTQFPNGVESVTSAQFIEMWGKKVAGQTIDITQPGVDLKLLVGERKLLGKGADAEWIRVKSQIDSGVRPDPESLNTIIQAASIAGDHVLLEELGERMRRFEATEEAGRASLPVQQQALTEARALGTSGQLAPGEAAWIRDLEKVIATTKDRLEHDPIALAAERFPERFAMPAPIDLGARDEALKGLNTRVQMARFVGQTYDRPSVMALSTGDRSHIAGAIAGPDPKRASVAFDVLASIPDDHFAATLRSEDIRNAIGGAARSTDPVKFSSAMMAIDRLWARAPEDVNRILGEDVVKTLQNWQAKLRYSSPAELAEQLKRRDDPQVIEQHKRLEQKGREIARKHTIKQITDDLDPGLFTIGPDVPTDARTRDAAVADYESVFAERYAQSLDEKVARQQTIERMSLYWGRSKVNNGRLTLHAPETVYPAINGSHDWLKDQLRTDLTTRLGTVPDDHNVVADRTTEADISAGRPPSYLVVTKNAKGEWDIVRGADQRPLRYRWDIGPGRELARDYFQRQRQRVFGGRASDGSISDIVAP